MSLTRPKIFEPTLRLYNRPIHPEFFRIVAAKTLRRKEYEVELTITGAGHVVSWHGGGRTLVEVVVANHLELPGKPVFSRSLAEPSDEPAVFSENDFYRNVSRFEDVPPDFFQRLEKEFLQSPEPNGLLYRFGFSGRMNLGGIAYLGFESFARQVKVRSIHTFPDDGVFLKTESVIRRIA